MYWCRGLFFSFRDTQTFTIKLKLLEQSKTFTTVMKSKHLVCVTSITCTEDSALGLVGLRS